MTIVMTKTATQIQTFSKHARTKSTMTAMESQTLTRFISRGIAMKMKTVSETRSIQQLRVLKFLMDMSKTLTTATTLLIRSIHLSKKYATTARTTTAMEMLISVSGMEASRLIWLK